MSKPDDRLVDLLRLKKAAEQSGDADDGFAREIGRQIAEEVKRSGQNTRHK